MAKPAQGVLQKKRRVRPPSMRAGGASVRPPSRLLVQNFGSIQGVGMPVPPRVYADRCAEQGVALLARGLNACNNPDLPYRYSRAAIDRFERIVQELVGIFQDGDIVETPLPSNHETDRDFQAFMRKATAAVDGAA